MIKNENKNLNLLIKYALLFLSNVGFFVNKLSIFLVFVLKDFLILLKIQFYRFYLFLLKALNSFVHFLSKIYTLFVHLIVKFADGVSTIVLLPKVAFLWLVLKYQNHKKLKNEQKQQKQLLKQKNLAKLKKQEKLSKNHKLSQKPKVGFLTKFSFFTMGVVFSLIAVTLPLELYRWYRQLPRPEMLLAANHNSTRILDRKGRLLYEIYDDKLYEYATLNKIPVELVQATMSVEDKEFYDHIGIRPLSIVRAAKATFLDAEVQGASTITQQLIKNSLLTPERTYSRKAKEIAIALMVERKYSKDQIMELYLNNAPYGGTAWGVQAASKKFFDKNVWELTLAESSMLAGLPLSPTEYNPFVDFEKAKARQKFVLSEMVEEGYITQAQASKAYAQKLTFATQQEYIRAPHFVNYIRETLEKTYGQRMVSTGGLTVTTSLDLDLQDKVQKIVAQEIENSGYLNITNGSALVVDATTNEILAYVGSKNYFAQDYDGKYDVVRAYRQPGSSIKPLAYALALESGMTPASTLNDSPLAINTGTEVYKPVNYDGRFHGVVSLRSALANSYNIPAVRLSVQLGPDAIVAKGFEAGLTNWQVDGTYGYSVVLGGKEARLFDMVNLYSTFARKGYNSEIVGIRSVKDSNGFEIYRDNRKETQVFSEGVSYLISDILSDNFSRTPAFGPNSSLVVDNRKHVAVKTGTTDMKKDNWTIGYTPEYVVGVWVGNNDGTPMSQYLASGLSGAAPIWNSVMKEVLVGIPDTSFDLPASVVKKTYKECGNSSELFISGTELDTICKKVKKGEEIKYNEKND